LMLEGVPFLEGLRSILEVLRLIDPF
jgi:hypothetical protein